MFATIGLDPLALPADERPSLELHHPAAELVVDEADDEAAGERLLDRRGVALAGREVAVLPFAADVAVVVVPGAALDAEGDLRPGGVLDLDRSGVLDVRG